MKRVVVACIAALGLPAAVVVPGPAFGHGVGSGARTHRIAPPGNSGVNQYVENVPTAKGGRPTGTIHSGGGAASAGGGGGGSGSSGTIPSGTEHALQAHGSAGRAAAALASATAPGGLGSATAARGRSVGKASGGRTDASANVAGAGGASAPAAVLDSLTGTSGSGGLGILLPLILVGCLLAASALGYLRWRRHSG